MNWMCNIFKNLWKISSSLQHTKQGIDQIVLCDDQGEQNVQNVQEEKNSL